MLVSIVTPSFNQGEFLEQALRSVLTQDYARIEYIVVDGASTDNSLEVIRRYAGRLAWWVSEPDGGQADAIRKGFSRARGEVLAWVNSDDLLAPGAVGEAVAALRAHPRAGLVYGDAVSIDAGGKPLNDMRFGDWGVQELAAFHIICQPAVFMRRSAYEAAGGLDPSYHFLLDHHLWLRIAAQGVVHHEPRLWAFARQHPGAKNVAQAGEFGREAHRIVSWMESDPALGTTLREHERPVRAAALRFDARYLLDGGQSWTAFKTYLRALTTHPRTALGEWHRIIFAGLSAIGLRKLGAIYYRWKRGRGSAQLRGVENVEELYPVDG